MQAPPLSKQLVVPGWPFSAVLLGMASPLFTSHAEAQTGTDQCDANGCWGLIRFCSSQGANAGSCTSAANCPGYKTCQIDGSIGNCGNFTAGANAILCTNATSARALSRAHYPVRSRPAMHRRRPKHALFQPFRTSSIRSFMSLAGVWSSAFWTYSRKPPAPIRSPLISQATSHRCARSEMRPETVR